MRMERRGKEGGREGGRKGGREGGRDFLMAIACCKAALNADEDGAAG
jgi:hypothetical protein